MLRSQTARVVCVCVPWRRQGSFVHCSYEFMSHHQCHVNKLQLRRFPPLHFFHITKNIKIIQLEAASEVAFRCIDTDCSEVAWVHLHLNCINNAMRLMGFKWTLRIFLEKCMRYDSRYWFHDMILQLFFTKWDSRMRFKKCKAVLLLLLR